MKFWNLLRLFGNIALLTCGVLALIISMQRDPDEQRTDTRTQDKPALQSGTSGL